LLLAEKEFVLGQESRNDLEAAVVDAHPEIGRIFGRLWEAGAKRVRLSGSGSAVFAVFDSVEELKEAEKSLANEPWQLIPTRTVGRKEYWETLMRVVSSQELVVR
jgi:4-diphosphocytidyl-2C-methyl-D-erythritol kinase